MPYGRKRFGRRRRGFGNVRRSHFRKARGGMRRSRALKVFYGRKASQAIIRQPSGLPDRLYVKLRYRAQYAFTQAAGALSYNVFRGNGPFDPDQTGAGGQPYLFDQWSTFYSYVTALASSIDVISVNNGGTPENTVVMVCPANTSTTFGAAGQELMAEQPYCKRTMNRMGGAGEGQSRIHHYMGSSKVIGVKRSALENDLDYGSAITTTPASQWFWHVGNYTPGSATQSLIQDVILTYYCVFETRQRPGTS